MTAVRSLVLLALLAGACPAAAFVRSTTDSGRPLFWPTPVVPYHVNTAQSRFADSCAGGAGGDDGALAAARTSFDAWMQPCSNLELAYAGRLDDLRGGELGGAENLVVFRQGFCSVHPQASTDPCMTDVEIDCGNLYNCYEDHGSADRGTLALTSVLYYPDTGRIVNADIEVVGWDGVTAALPTGVPLHGTYFTCVDPDAAPNGACTSYGDSGCYYHDLQNTLTHEVGHFVGLRHVCYGGSAADVDLPPCGASYEPVTMYPRAAVGEIGKRSLDEDDIAGVCAAYPDDGGGGCGCGSGGATGIAALVALLSLRRRRARARPSDQATTTPA